MKFTTTSATFLLLVAGVLRPASGELIGTFGLVTIEATHAPTPQLPGFSTWTVTAKSSLPIRAFDFRNGGFSGPMHRVNPLGASTVYEDANPFFAFVDADPAQDSQFKFQSASINRGAQSQFESGTSLRADFSAPLSTPFGTSVDFAQLVIPDNGIVQFSGFVFRGPVFGNSISDRVFGTLRLVPEPSNFPLMISATIVAASRRRKSAPTIASSKRRRAD